MKSIAAWPFPDAKGSAGVGKNPPNHMVMFTEKYKHLIVQ